MLRALSLPVIVRCAQPCLNSVPGIGKICGSIRHNWRTPMLPDGFYGAWFKTPRGEGAGVVTLANGQLRGGDSALAYSGTFAQDGEHFTAIVATDRHAHGSPSVFGIDAVDISLTGKFTGASITCTGTAKQAPDLTIQAVLTRISD
jgi:hypothetical protein